MAWAGPVLPVPNWTETSEAEDRPAVQVGDPFLEKSLIEACLLAFNTGAVVAAQDMGAAGISPAPLLKWPPKVGVGIDLDLDLIPVRETGMVPLRVFTLRIPGAHAVHVAHKGREQELIDIFHRWGLHAVVAGEVIADPYRPHSVPRPSGRRNPRHRPV